MCTIILNNKKYMLCKLWHKLWLKELKELNDAEESRIAGEIYVYHIPTYKQPLSIKAIKGRKTFISSRLFGVFNNLLHKKELTKKALS